MAMKRRQARAVAEQKAALRQARRQARADDLYHDILVARAEQAGKLTHLPPPAERHTTPALDAAARTAGAEEYRPAPDTPEDTAAREETARRLKAAGEVVKLPKMTEEEEFFRRARSIERALEAGEPVAERDEAWLASYRRTSEYRSSVRHLKNFPNWLGG